MPRLPSSLRRAALPLAALLVLPAALAGAATCPYPKVFWCGPPDCVTAEETGPATLLDGTPWTPLVPCPGMCFNLPIGTVASRCSGDASGPYFSEGAAGVDAFVIESVTGTDPVPALVALELEGSTSGNSGSTGYLQLGSDRNTRVSFTQTAPTARFTHEVLMPVQFVPGQPLVLEYGVDSYAVFPGGAATALGRLFFANLPDGAFVSSCWHYNVFPVVPARPSTWGALKATYR